MKLMKIQGYQAVISFDPDIGMFCGEFLGLNGGADFYAIDWCCFAVCCCFSGMIRFFGF
jgi:hypothetical protein